MAAIAEGAAVDIDASRGVLEVHDSFDGETGEWSRGTRVVCGPALDEYLRPCRHHEECIRDKIKDVLDGHTFACDRAGREITCSGAYHGYDDGTSSGVLSLVFRDGGSGRYTLDAVVTADHPSYSDHAAERARMADQRRFVRRALSAHRERCGAGRTKSTK